MAAIYIKRIYEPAEKSDGLRILVDRLWPRGLKKENAHIDAWTKDIAPSTTLRKWFDHDPKKWQEFIARYTSELETTDGLEKFLELIQDHETVTMLYAAHDEEHNHALVLQQLLTQLNR